MTAVVVVLTVVVILLCVLVGGLLRSHAEMLRAFNEMGVTFGQGEAHTAAPAASSPTAATWRATMAGAACG